MTMAAPTSSVPAREALLSTHMRWLEMVARETTDVPSRKPGLSMIPAPAVAQAGGRHRW